MIPTTPRDNGSRGEAKLFRLIAGIKASKDTICLHSLNLSRHEYKKSGELDFVLLSCEGLFVLEVKGGRVSRGEDGIWNFTDRFGFVHRKSEGPFDQAKSGMYSLINNLSGQFGKDLKRIMAYGYGVVFPDIVFRIDTVEWPAEIVLDSPNMNQQGVERYLARLTKFWTSGKSDSYAASNSLLKEIADFLRPAFDVVPSLRAIAGDLEAKQEFLTREQYERLDIIEANPRIIINGAAGTGKTFLAAEIARRESASGHKAAFVCSGSVLSAYLRSKIAENVPILTVKQLASQSGSCMRGRFDVLVVDEAQDFLDLEHLSILDRLLQGGLENGVWRIFLDPNEQSRLLGVLDKEAIDLLKSFGAVDASLSRNCRNTTEIALQTRLLTGADIGISIAGHGPPVQFSYYETESDGVLQLSGFIRKLISEDIAANEITILSTLDFEHSIAHLLPLGILNGISIINARNASEFRCGKISFSTIGDFKGMENQFIAVVDLTSAGKSDESIAQLYVAMTRARAGLWLAVPEVARTVLRRLSEKHLPSVLSEFQGIRESEHEKIQP